MLGSVQRETLHQAIPEDAFCPRNPKPCGTWRLPWPETMQWQLTEWIGTFPLVVRKWLSSVRKPTPALREWWQNLWLFTQQLHMTNGDGGNGLEHILFWVYLQLPVCCFRLGLRMTLDMGFSILECSWSCRVCLGLELCLSVLVYLEVIRKNLLPLRRKHVIQSFTYGRSKFQKSIIMSAWHWKALIHSFMLFSFFSFFFPDWASCETFRRFKVGNGRRAFALQGAAALPGTLWLDLTWVPY